MIYQATPLFERNSIYRVSNPTVFILSVILHVFFLIIIPVLSSVFHKSSKFERPKTFQLVMPLKPAPTPKVQPKKDVMRQRMPQEERKETPRQSPDANAVRKQTRDSRKEQDAARPKENLDELSSLLDEIPAPVQVSASSSNFNHVYFQMVSEKVQRYWKPTKEDRTVRVTVSFTIKRDGSITEPRVESSSGNRTLDNLALRAVTIAAPFPRLPLAFKEDVQINLTLIPTRK